MHTVTCSMLGNFIFIIVCVLAFVCTIDPYGSVLHIHLDWRLLCVYMYYNNDGWTEGYVSVRVHTPGILRPLIAMAKSYYIGVGVSLFR